MQPVYLAPALMLAGLLASAGCAAIFERNDPPDLHEFAERIQFDNGLSVLAAGDPNAPMVLFIHGTPGSWHAFEAYLQHADLRPALHLVAVDRPGFGGSKDMGLAPSLRSQSQILSQALALNRSRRPVLIVGHSLGGSIGTRLALDRPEAVGGLIILSSAVSAELSKPRWYNRLAATPLVRYLIPEDLRLANREVMPLSDELALIQDDLHTLNIPVTLVQGDKDPLVDPKNADFVESKLTQARLKLDRFPGEGHFIVWSHVDHVAREILRLSKLL